MNQYYAISQAGDAASIAVYGDIAVDADGADGAAPLSAQIERIQAATIDVCINSYGGDVAEGLAVYHALKRHKARVVTHCDAFACSAASVVFMAGDERRMGVASLLMVHHVWSIARGNAAELRKTADDLDAISAAAANVYKEVVTIDEQTLCALLDGETWITPQDALRMGFATGIEGGARTDRPAAGIRAQVMQRLLEQPAPPDPDRIAQSVCERLAAWAAREQEGTFLGALMRRGGTQA